MITISYVITADETVEKVFNFFRTIDKWYLSLSRGHRKFQLTNGKSLAKGVCISNEETVSGQCVTHAYRVTDIVENRYIKLVSTQSTATVLKIFRLPLTVIVEFEMETIQNGMVKVSSHLTLEFKNKISELFAYMLNTKQVWEAHLKEEMENGLRIIKSQ